MAQRFSMFVRIRPEGVEDVLRSDYEGVDADVIELVTLALAPLDEEIDVERA